MRCRVTIDLSIDNSKILSETEHKLVDYILSSVRDLDISDSEKIRTQKEITFQCSYDLQTCGDSYHTPDIEFTQVAYGKKYIYTIDGFAQVSRAAADFAHKTVADYLQEFRSNPQEIQIIGIGGESLIYAMLLAEICLLRKSNQHKPSIQIYTNSSGVHRNNLTNSTINGDVSADEKNTEQSQINCCLVDYETFEMPKQTIPTVLFANVSRNGMRRTLCQKVDQLYILDIIGVYCSDSYLSDLQLLSNYYIYKSTSMGNLTIVHFKRIPLVSLGNTCVVAYQLFTHKLRTKRYPFDWIRYKSVDQLIACLSDDYARFVDFVSEKVPIGSFVIAGESDFNINSEQKSKIIKTNAYGMAFPHDILDETDVQKYRERIDRLKSIPQVDYVLDCTVNAEQKNALITLLPNMRKLLIINEKEQFVTCVSTSYQPDKQHKFTINLSKKKHTILSWQKNYIDWISVFQPN